MSRKSYTLSDVFNAAIKASELSLRVMLPVKVNTYYPDEQKVDVAPLLKKKYSDGTVRNLPVITGVPVEWPVVNDGKSYLIMPLKANDTGKVVFSDRSLDLWLSGEGDPVEPLDNRAHSLSDAVFWPGMRPFKKAIAPENPDNLYLKNDNMTLELFPDGKIKLQGASKEVMNVISTYMGHVNSGLVNTGIGPQSWLASTKAQLDSDKNDFDSLKG